MKVSVATKGKSTISLDFPGKTAAQVTVRDVKAGVTNKFPQVSIGLCLPQHPLEAPGYYDDVSQTYADTQLVANRQRLGLPTGEKPIPLTDENKTLAEYGVSDDVSLRLKDLGPQVGYRWLYIWEYVRLPNDTCSTQN